MRALLQTKELAAKLADSVEKFNNILTRLKSLTKIASPLSSSYTAIKNMIWYMKSEKLMTLVDGQRKVSSWRGFFLTVFAWRKAGAVGGHC